MAFTLDDIKALREKTSAGMALCKEALTASDGDMKKAIEYINQRSDVVSRLRDLTGAKIGLCKIALEDAGNDFEKAAELIKERGWDNPVGTEEVQSSEGVIDVYLHGAERKLFAAVEVHTKTDFVAKNDQFRAFVHELTLQVAATKPKYVSSENIPVEEVEKMKELFKKEAELEGKPANILEKIIEGKLNKYFAEYCLMEQKWFKDESKTIRSLFDDAVTKMGEPLVVKRITYWELGK
jgi:elongation factor Ts